MALVNVFMGGERMALEYPCECGEVLLLSTKIAGKVRTCPWCLQDFQVPAPLGKGEDSTLSEAVCPNCSTHLEGESLCSKCGVDIQAWKKVRGKLKKKHLRPSRRKSRSPLSKGASKEARKKVESMRRELHQLRSQLKNQEEIEKSLEEARRKQLTMLPPPPDFPGLQFHAIYRPCQHIGGDFYTFIPLGGEEIGIAIGDVSGHGLEAGLVMGMAKKTIEIYGRQSSSPREVLCLTNEDLFQDLDHRTFVTVFYGVLNPQKKALRFVKAGHNPLILYNPHRDHSMELFEAEGMGVGMVDSQLFDQVLEEKEIPLHSGDLLVQFTDGVTEAMNEEGEPYGMERLLARIEEYGSFDLEYLNYLMESDIEAFCQGAEQRDDITLLSCKVE